MRTFLEFTGYGGDKLLVCAKDVFAVEPMPRGDGELKTTININRFRPTYVCVRETVEEVFKRLTE